MIHNFSAVVTGSLRLTQMAKCLDVPVIVTEQYPKGLGHTVPQLKSQLEDANVTTVAKTEFTMMTEQVKQVLAANTERDNIILAGIEAHICVQQETHCAFLYYTYLSLKPPT